jgi:hypothetical protein
MVSRGLYTPFVAALSFLFMDLSCASIAFVSSLPPSLGFPQLGIGPVLFGGAIPSMPLRLTFVLSIVLFVVW